MRTLEVRLLRARPQMAPAVEDYCRQLEAARLLPEFAVGDCLAGIANDCIEPALVGYR